MNKCSAFTVKSDGLLSRLETDISVECPSGRLQTLKVKGLWDTGATNTCISKSLVEMLGISICSGARMGTTGGMVETETCIIDIGLPNNVIIKGIKAFVMDIEDDIDVLIGMDIIMMGDFSITNKDEKTVFSFRMPSIG